MRPLIASNGGGHERVISSILRMVVFVAFVLERSRNETGASLTFLHYCRWNICAFICSLLNRQSRHDNT